MDKKLLTPGPLTTSLSTKEAMLHDWGSRDQKFIELNHSIRESLVKLIEGQDNYQCVPMQGSGTFAVESMISSLTPKDAKILILINGAYGHRMKKMCSYLNRNCIDYEVAEHEQHNLIQIEKIIDDVGYLQNKNNEIHFGIRNINSVENSIEMNYNINNNKNLSLVKALQDLGNNYGYRLVAEGIESEEMLKKLQTVGCEFGQGYHISRPAKMVKNINETITKVSA